MRGRWIANLVLAGVALLTVACDGSPPADRPDGAAPVTVRVHMPHDPASLSLLGKPDKQSEIVAVQLTDSLVQFDAELSLQPRVASSWEFSDDRLTLTFRLREGVRWHDGTDVTADDVIFSVEAARKPVSSAIAFLLDEAARFYASGDAGLSALSWRCALSIRTARRVYAAIGGQIRGQDCDPLAGRAVVTMRRKLALTSRALMASLADLPRGAGVRLSSSVRLEAPRDKTSFPGDVLPV